MGKGRTEDHRARSRDCVQPNSRAERPPARPRGSSQGPHSALRGARHSLGEVGQVLGDLGDEGEGAGGAVVRVLLQQVEERG